MFSWLKRSSRPARLSTLPRTLLRLELLETRDCPAGPIITTLNVQVESGKQVLITGGLSDDNPQDCTINFSGEVSGSTTADALGDFSLTTTADALGTITAQAHDAVGQTGNQVQATITSTPPVIRLSEPTPQSSGGTIVLSGQVTVGTASGLTVVLGGTATGCGVTDANGNFTMSVAASNWGPGSATARTTDDWGQASNTANVNLTNTAPAISNFTVSWNANGLATFQGQVTDEYASGETVRLWGVPTLNATQRSAVVTSDSATAASGGSQTAGTTQGYATTTVGSNNWFVYSVQLTPQDRGTVSAQVTDWLGQTSNTATLTI